MENTEYIGFISLPANKEEKARRELETINLMSKQAKRKDAEMRTELAELDRRREDTMDRITHNREEIRGYVKRSEKLTEFLALAEEI